MFQLHKRNRAGAQTRKFADNHDFVPSSVCRAIEVCTGMPVAYARKGCQIESREPRHQHLVLEWSSSGYGLPLFVEVGQCLRL